MKGVTLEDSLQETMKHIYFYLLKIGASQEDAEDLVQESAYKFLLYTESVPLKNPEGWLFRITLNAYYDLSKIRKGREKILLRFYQDFDHKEDHTPEAAALQSEVAAEVTHTLNRMKESHREVLLLKYAADLSITDISIMIGKKEQGVKSLLHRARLKFIKLYEGGQGE